jgi:hypothetical protein
MDYKKGIDLDRVLATSGMYLIFSPDFALKGVKKLDPLKSQSRSLCGMLIISVLKAARLRFFNGPNLKNKSMLTMSVLLKAA